MHMLMLGRFSGGYLKKEHLAKVQSDVSTAAPILSNRAILIHLDRLDQRPLPHHTQHGCSDCRLILLYGSCTQQCFGEIRQYFALADYHTPLIRMM